MENKLNEQIEQNAILSKKLGNYIKNGIVSEVCEGLAHSQRDKVMSLAEGVEFGSEESFREKMETIKESYFPVSKPVALTEDVSLENTQVSDSMAAYMNAISRWILIGKTQLIINIYKSTQGDKSNVQFRASAGKVGSHS